VVNCIKTSKNKIVTASSDSTLKIWDFQSAHVVEKHTLLGHESDVCCLAIYGEWIASGAADSLVIVWNLMGQLMHKLIGHLGVVRHIYIDEHKLITGGDAKRLIIWDYKVSLFLLLMR
jgi:F-box and WD-40 domain protein 7